MHGTLSPATHVTPSPHGRSEETSAALLQLCDGEAQGLIDTPTLEARGFESWRLLTARYSPCGGQYELDNMLSLLTRKPVKDAVGIPGAASVSALVSLIGPVEMLFPMVMMMVNPVAEVVT